MVCQHRARTTGGLQLTCNVQATEHSTCTSLLAKHDFSNNLQLHLNNLVGNFSRGSKSLKYYAKFECRRSPTYSDEKAMKLRTKPRQTSDLLSYLKWKPKSEKAKNKSRRNWRKHKYLNVAISNLIQKFFRFRLHFVGFPLALALSLSLSHTLFFWFFLHRYDVCEKVHDTPPIFEVNKFKYSLNYFLACPKHGGQQKSSRLVRASYHNLEIIAVLFLTHDEPTNFVLGFERSAREEGRFCFSHLF